MKKLNADTTISNTRSLIMFIAKSYSLTNDRKGFDQAEAFLKNNFGKDNTVIRWLEHYRF
ncbi:MAG: hypothetical protein LBU66_04765 [Treponema sp.]|jgi:hypothetical protein|nr:hypothetical protein [Treponema sp.]